MKLFIDKTELELLLEKNRDYIGNHHYDGIDKVFAGLTFTVPSIFADYSSFLIFDGNTVKTILLIIGTLYTLWGIVNMINNFTKGYSHKNLLNDIEKLNKITHPFSIIAIKDTFKDFSNRFLLYYDERWDCKFFFNYRTVDNDKDNIIKRLSNELKIPIDSIHVDFKTESVYEKYSISDKKSKIYDHKIYYVEIDSYNDELKKDTFKIDGKNIIG